jgi:aromatic-L-amino-acid decarboxylase
MAPEEFRKAGHQVVDWIADYLANIRDYPVLPRHGPGELAAKLPATAPDTGEPIDRVLADFDKLIIPHVNHWNHPRFHCYFSVSASGTGILAEMLMSTLNINAMLWKSCPAATELEQVTLEWLRDWIGLPPGAFGIIYDTASTSVMHAIAAARESAFPENRTEGGLRDAVCYTSEHAHNSFEKGAIALGIGQRNVRRIATDENFAMHPGLLAQAIAADKQAGKRPFCVCASIGTTSTSAIDPVPAIAGIAEREGLWLHVDAAYAGPAAILPEMSKYFEGWDRADSVVLNPHKWLFTPIDISVLYTRHQQILRRAFSLSAEYLRTAEDSTAINYMDYGVQLGRRFRALKLWFVMRYFGREGVSAILREHLRIARELACWIRQDSRFELMAPVPFSLVCFRLKSSNEANQALLDAINASGCAFLSHTVLNGKLTLRLAIGNVKTTIDDIAGTWAEIQRLA